MASLLVGEIVILLFAAFANEIDYCNSTLTVKLSLSGSFIWGRIYVTTSPANTTWVVNVVTNTGGPIFKSAIALWFNGVATWIFKGYSLKLHPSLSWT